MVEVVGIENSIGSHQNTLNDIKYQSVWEHQGLFNLTWYCTGISRIILERNAKLGNLGNQE
jgi:hypothetical protein